MKLNCYEDVSLSRKTLSWPIMILNKNFLGQIIETNQSKVSKEVRFSTLGISSIKVALQFINEIFC